MDIFSAIKLDVNQVRLALRATNASKLEYKGWKYSNKQYSINNKHALEYSPISDYMYLRSYGLSMKIKKEMDEELLIDRFTELLNSETYYSTTPAFVGLDDIFYICVMFPVIPSLEAKGKDEKIAVRCINDTKTVEIKTLQELIIMLTFMPFQLDGPQVNNCIKINGETTEITFNKFNQAIMPFTTLENDLKNYQSSIYHSVITPYLVHYALHMLEKPYKQYKYVVDSEMLRFVLDIPNLLYDPTTIASVVKYCGAYQPDNYMRYIQLENFLSL